jgi:hypothetical protein
MNQYPDSISAEDLGWELVDELMSLENGYGFGITREIMFGNIVVRNAIEVLGFSATNEVIDQICTIIEHSSAILQEPLYHLPQHTKDLHGGRSYSVICEPIGNLLRQL